MITPMIITFRESLEILLVIVPLMTYLFKIDRKNLFRSLLSGCTFGALTTIVLGVILSLTTGRLTGYSRELFLGSTMLFLAGLILYNIVLINKQDKQYTSQDNDIDYNSANASFSIFLLGYLTVFRETLEILIFILPLLNENFIGMVGGITLGAIISIGVMYLLYKTTAKLSVRVIFSILTFMLIVIGASLFGEGLGILMPSMSSLETAGKLIYGIPLGYFFLKKESKKYLKKKS